MSSGSTIPILDLSPEIDELWQELNDAFQRVIRSGQFIMGPDVGLLESECSEYLGAKHAISCNSGTDALVIGLRAIGIQPGDEVITTPFTFFATAESISNVGAKPVFVDVEEGSMNINPDLIQSAITERTKAVMPVHIFGRPASMGKIMSIAQRHDLKVLEDCAQSFGATYLQGCDGCDLSCGGSSFSGKQTGTIGIFGAYSFFPSKNLGAYGDGGLMTTESDEAAEIAKMLRVHGSKRRYQNEALGYNSRLDTLQAAILRVKLKRLPTYNQMRAQVAARYNQLLADVAEVICPEVSPGHVFHQYTIRVKGGKRDQVVAKMQEKGVGCMVYYPIPQHQLPVYRGQYPSYSVSEQLATEVMSLPIWPQISEEKQQTVVRALKESLTEIEETSVKARVALKKALGA